MKKGLVFVLGFGTFVVVALGGLFVLGLVLASFLRSS